MDKLLSILISLIHFSRIVRHFDHKGESKFKFQNNNHLSSSLQFISQMHLLAKTSKKTYLTIQKPITFRKFKLLN